MLYLDSIIIDLIIIKKVICPFLQIQISLLLEKELNTKGEVIKLKEKTIKYDYGSLRERLLKEKKLLLIAFAIVLISDFIGMIKIPVGKGNLILFPIFYAIFIGVALGPDVTKVFSIRECKAASKLVIVAICPFIAKLGINAGMNIPVVLSAGPALLLQEFGNLFTILLALPFALLIGLKRESIGATHSINRESNLALVMDLFGPESPEARGSLSIYIVGGMVGTIYFGLLAAFVAGLDIFHPYALGMSSGVGAGIMMASAVATLSEIYPQYADKIAALASASETLSGITGIYAAMFIGIPLTNFLYKKLYPIIGRGDTNEN